ncbi:MAG: M20/M25/M40 family metallo-hydrolase [Planctomycetes bacterium]|nr:M20/M25/M40 family metallo-hydrolase [Planctomycetota bacterium]
MMQSSKYRWPCSIMIGVIAVAASRGYVSAAEVAAKGAAKGAMVTRAVTISHEEYLGHIALLAHDELGGRGTGSDGIDLAAGYIAGQFAAAGLSPGGPDGTYFQEFTFPSRSGAKILEDTALRFDGSDVQPAVNTDFLPLSFSTMGKFDGDLVFVGYGATNPDKDYDDYAGIDVDGKVVIMLRREPPDWPGDSRFTTHATFESKAKLAKRNGATAMIIVNRDDDRGELRRFRPDGETYGIPAIHLNRDLAEKVLSAGGLASLSDLQKGIDEGGKPASAVVAGVRASGEIAYETNDITARNVLGVLRGTGPHADEYVVIGGHYDHLGVRRGEIHNGADDNASGTAGVIEIAKALARTPKRDRSVICMAFTGEEIGLIGSKYYTANPTVPIDSIAAMINMDMIGRHNDSTNKLDIQGLGTGSVFKEIVERRAAEAGIEFRPDDSAKGPSDHDSFYRAGVPSLFFFTGVHPDYHGPGDDTEKVNVEGAVAIAELVYQIAMDIIDGDEAPQYVEVDQPAHIDFSAMMGSPGSPMGGPPRGGVVMGILPDRTDDPDKPGWRVVAVMEGGGAATAGMKDGDVIIAIDGKAINGLDDFRDQTKDKKPGDVIAVKIRRGDEEMTLDVTLAARSG